MAKLIVQVPEGSEVERRLRESPPPGAEATIDPVTADDRGRIDPPVAAKLVSALLSPEALVRERDQVREAVRAAGEGAEPLAITLEAVEELREDELRAALDAAAESDRDVILVVLREA